LEEDLDALYSVLGWDSSPRSNRLVESYVKLRKLLSLGLLRECLTGKKHVKVLDCCSGGGIGGYALAKALEDEGFVPEVLFVDLACSLLPRVSQRVLLSDSVCGDARNLSFLRPRLFDISVIWGCSSAHFNPFEMHRVLAGLSLALSSNGCLLIEEVDRMQSVFLGTGYRYVWPEPSDRAAISLHRGYDPCTSTVRRALIDLSSGRIVEHRVCMLWTPALVAALAYPYFREVEIVLESESRGIVVCCKPRGSISARDAMSFAEPLTHYL